MFKKITAILPFFAIFQLIDVAQGSELCSITLGGVVGTGICNFPMKNQTECIEAERLIQERFNCFYGAGNGCSTNYSYCTKDKDVAAEFDNFCAGIKGVKGTSQDKSSGACVPHEYIDSSMVASSIEL